MVRASSPRLELAVMMLPRPPAIKYRKSSDRWQYHCDVCNPKIIPKGVLVSRRRPCFLRNILEASDAGCQTCHAIYDGIARFEQTWGKMSDLLVDVSPSDVRIWDASGNPAMDLSLEFYVDGQHNLKFDGS